MCTWILYQKTSNFRTTINLGIYQQCCRCLHFLHQILYLLPPSPHLPEHDLSNSVPYINICIYINEIMHLAEQVARPFRTETIFSVLITCLDHFYNLKVMTSTNTALHVLLQFIIDHSLEIIFLFFTMNTSSLSWFFKLFPKKYWPLNFLDDYLLFFFLFFIGFSLHQFTDSLCQLHILQSTCIFDGQLQSVGFRHHLAYLKSPKFTVRSSGQLQLKAF